MKARFRAAYYVLCLVSRAASAPPPSPDVSLLLRGSGLQKVALREMKSEVAGRLGEAGVNVHWGVSSGAQDVNGLLVVVRMRGSCGVPSHADVRLESSSSAVLGASVGMNGRILPFVNIDCIALNGLLAPRITRLPSESRNYLFGRALGRILAHELYHYLGQTSAHTTEGLARSNLGARDLLIDRSEFDDTARDRLRNSVSPRASASSEPTFYNESDFAAGK